MPPMLTLDTARQLVADRRELLRATPRRHARRPTPRAPHRLHTPRLRPVRRLLDWLDRTTPAAGARLRRRATAVEAAPC